MVAINKILLPACEAENRGGLSERCVENVLKMPVAKLKNLLAAVSLGLVSRPSPYCFFKNPHTPDFSYLPVLITMPDSASRPAERY